MSYTLIVVLCHKKRTLNHRHNEHIFQNVIYIIPLSFIRMTTIDTMLIPHIHHSIRVPLIPSQTV